MTELSAQWTGTPGASLVVVFLHGFTMKPEDFASFGPSLGVSALYVFPRGTIEAGGTGFSWWDVDRELREKARATGPRDLLDFDPPGLDSANARLQEFLRSVREANPNAKCVVGGFSQGGMLACDVMVSDPGAADGLVVFSGSRVAFARWRGASPSLRGLPVLVAHGRRDDDISFDAGRELAEWLKSAGAAVTWMPFDGGHEIPLQGWRALRRFLLQIPSKYPAA